MDITEIIINSQWKTQQVGYHYTFVEPARPNGLTRWWEMKANAAPFPGWPADVNQFDDEFVYFFVTEDDDNLHDTSQPKNWNPKTGPWSNRFDPTCYKMQTGVPGKGMIVLPRNIGSLPWGGPLYRISPSTSPRRRSGEERRKGGSPNPDTQYQHVVACKPAQTKMLGTAATSFDGPFNMAWGNDLGNCPTYVMNYEYSNGKAKERFFYAMRPDGGSYGWVGWELWPLDPTSGMYKMSASSYRNNLVNVAPPTPLNPCKF